MDDKSTRLGVTDCKDCDPAGPTRARCVTLLDAEHEIDMFDSGKDPDHSLYGAAIGLKLLAKLGAFRLEGVGRHVSVCIGEDAWTGRRLVERHEMQLRKLGWFVQEVERSREPLRLEYRR
jgi:hypothetical protein